MRRPVNGRLGLVAWRLRRGCAMSHGGDDRVLPVVQQYGGGWRCRRPKLEEDGRKVWAYVIVKRLCSSWCACALIESRLRPIDRCERELSLLERDDGRGGEEAARSADRSSPCSTVGQNEDRRRSRGWRWGEGGLQMQRGQLCGCYGA